MTMELFTYEKNRINEQIFGQCRDFTTAVSELVKNEGWHILTKKDIKGKHIAIFVDTISRKAMIIGAGGGMRRDIEFKRYLKIGRKNNTGKSEQGSGGKGASSQAHVSFSLFDSCCDYKRNLLRWTLDKTVPSEFEIDNEYEPHPMNIVDEYLSMMNLQRKHLPKEMIDIIQATGRVTVSYFDTIRSWEIPNKLAKRALDTEVDSYPSVLGDHNQLKELLPQIDLHFIKNKRYICKIKPTPIIPIDGVKPYKESLSDEVTDPRTGQKFSIDHSSGNYVVEINTSATRMTGKLEPNNVVSFHDGHNFKGKAIPMQQVVPGSTSYHMAVTIHCPEFEISGTDWTGGPIQMNAKIRAIMYDAERIIKTYATTVVNKALALDKVRKEAKSFKLITQQYEDAINSFIAATEGDGNARGSSNGDAQYSGSPAVKGKVSRIAVESSTVSLVVGSHTSVPLHVRCYGITPSGEEIRVKVPKNLFAISDTGLDVEYSDGFLTVGEVGIGEISLFDENGIESNSIKIMIVDLNGIEMSHPVDEVLQGDSVNLKPVMIDSNGINYQSTKDTKVLLQFHVDDNQLGGINSVGLFRARSKAGTLNCNLHYGKNKDYSFEIKVSHDEINRPKKPSVNKAGGITIRAVGEASPSGYVEMGGASLGPVLFYIPPDLETFWINFRSSLSLRIIGREPQGTKSQAYKLHLNEHMFMCVVERQALYNWTRDNGSETSPSFSEWSAYKTHAMMECAPLMKILENIKVDF